MNKTKNSLYRNLIFGLSTALLLIVVVFGWSARTELSGAVIAAGVVASHETSKSIQHLEGGIIKSINFKDGDYVKAGEVLLKMDNTHSRTRLTLIENRLIELIAEKARLESERDGKKSIEPPDLSFTLANASSLKEAIENQRKLFFSMRKTIKQKKEQLREQISQTELAISGLTAKSEATEKQAKLLRSELQVVSSLTNKGLSSKSRLIAHGAGTRALEWANRRFQSGYRPAQSKN